MGAPSPPRGHFLLLQKTSEPCLVRLLHFKKRCDFSVTGDMKSLIRWKCCWTVCNYFNVDEYVSSHILVRIKLSFLPVLRWSTESPRWKAYRKEVLLCPSFDRTACLFAASYARTLSFRVPPPAPHLLCRSYSTEVMASKPGISDSAAPAFSL